MLLDILLDKVTHLAIVKRGRQIVSASSLPGAEVQGEIEHKFLPQDVFFGKHTVMGENFQLLNGDLIHGFLLTGPEWPRSW